jgi:hypothetical protein
MIMMSEWIENNYDTLMLDYSSLIGEIFYNDEYEFKLFCKLAYMYRNLQDNKEWNINPTFEYVQNKYYYDEEMFQLITLYEYFDEYELESISDIIFDLWEIQEENQNTCMLYIIPSKIFFEFVYTILENKYILIPLYEETFDSFSETGLITEDTC